MPGNEGSRQRTSAKALGQEGAWCVVGTARRLCVRVGREEGAGGEIRAEQGQLGWAHSQCQDLGLALRSGTSAELVGSLLLC